MSDINKHIGDHNSRINEMFDKLQREIAGKLTNIESETDRSSTLDLERLNSSHASLSSDHKHREPKQYKVMTQKDKWFSQKFDPERLEQALNAYAKEGWVVKSICTASITGFGGNREELIVVFEK